MRMEQSAGRKSTWRSFWQVGELIMTGSHIHSMNCQQDLTYPVLVVMVVVRQAGIPLQLCHLTWLLEIKCLHQQVLRYNELARGSVL